MLRDSGFKWIFKENKKRLFALYGLNESHCVQCLSVTAIVLFRLGCLSSGLRIFLKDTLKSCILWKLVSTTEYKLKKGDCGFLSHKSNFFLKNCKI